MMIVTFGPAKQDTSRDQLGAILGDAAGLIFRADHETGDILQEDQRNFPLRAQLYEVCTLLRTLRK